MMQLLSEGEIARLRARRDLPQFAAAWADLTARAERALARPFEIPAEGAGWGHDYFCPDHATRLIFDPDLPHEHRCPVDGRAFRGEPYDGGWRGAMQRRIVEGLYAAAILWVGTGERRYAEHAGAVLRAYAARYPHYESHGEHAGKGRCMGQSLDEGTWSIPLAWAYDAVRETLPDEDRARIERDLLRPAAEHLHGQLWHRIHNIECWHLAGLATLGAVLDDERFVAPALEDAFGLTGQLREGALDDGWWWEGSPHYHFYALTAILSLALALRRRHPEALAQPRLRAMLDAPHGLLRADLSVPSLNDGWYYTTEPGHVATHAALYEIAHALWGEPGDAAFLARLYASGTSRAATEALLLGPDILPDAAPAAARSEVQDPSGYAVLRGGTPQRERWLLLKYGPHGGGHGHPDKLALDLHAFGRRLSPDLGTPGYGIALNRTWYRHTLAHNTVLLDEAGQPPATGRLLRFDANDGHHTVAEAAVTWPDDAPAPYAGVTLHRCILWKPAAEPYFLDVVRVTCPGATPRRIDLAWHHLGDLDLPGLAPVDLAAGGDTYPLLREARQLTARAWRATWHAEGAGTACWALDPPGTATIATRAPANPASETMSLLLRRATATEATFVAVYEPFLGAPTIRSVSWPAADDGVVALVEGDGWRDAWVIGERRPDTLPDLGDAVVHECLLTPLT